MSIYSRENGRIILKKKDKLVAYLLFFFLGVVGAHKFYPGRKTAGSFYCVLSLSLTILAGYSNGVDSYSTGFTFTFLSLLILLVISLLFDLFLLGRFVDQCNEKVRREAMPPEEGEEEVQREEARGRALTKKERETKDVEKLLALGLKQAIVMAIKNQLHTPNSFELVSTSFVVTKKSLIMITTTFRAENTTKTLVLSEAVSYSNFNSVVLSVDIQGFWASSPGGSTCKKKEEIEETGG